MKKVFVLVLLAALGWLAWRNRRIFTPYVNKDLEAQTKTVGLAEKSARKERARVTQGKAVDAAASGESVTDGMSRDEVRGILGDPSSIDLDAEKIVETWHYEAVGKKIIFRNGKVWSVEAN